MATSNKENKVKRENRVPLLSLRPYVPSSIAKVGKFLVTGMQLKLCGLFVLIAFCAIFVGLWSLKRRGNQARERAVELLLEVPGTWGHTAISDRRTSCVSTVRAVNHLREMGHKQAIVAIREFVETYPDSCRQGAINLLIPVLFDKPPSDSEFSKFWSHGYNLFETEQDLVFHGYPAMTGPCFHEKELLDWVAENGEIRATPLVPADNPFLAADQLLSRLRLSPDSEGDGFFRGLIDRHIYAQVYEATKHLGQSMEEPIAQAPLRNEEWITMKNAFSKYDIYWNQERQEYALRRFRN